MSNLDLRIIKASFRECSIPDRKTFYQSTCLIPISVGQSVHEGKKFLATMNLINSSFKSCTILIDDSIQRHTLKIIHTNHSNDFLYKRALTEGDAWLERNKVHIENLTIPYKIERWDRWLQHPDFIKQLNKISFLYETDMEYQHAIQSNINEYLTRYIIRTKQKDFNYENAFSLCLNYLMEECTVMCLWIHEKYQFEVYPSGRNKAMAATYNRLIKPFYPELLKSVALRFKKFPTVKKTEMIDCVENQ